MPFELDLDERARVAFQRVARVEVDASVGRHDLPVRPARAARGR